MPLFQQVPGGGRWRGWLSKAYHWAIIIYLFVGVVRLGHRLSVCQSQPMSQELDEEMLELCWGPWPPLAVDFIILLGSCMVLMSLGGLRNYLEQAFSFGLESVAGEHPFFRETHQKPATKNHPPPRRRSKSCLNGGDFKVGDAECRGAGVVLSAELPGHTMEELELFRC